MDSKTMLHNYIFILGRAELRWNFSSFLRNGADIHRFSTVHMVKTYFWVIVGRRKPWNRKNGILANFRCIFYCRKSVESEKREKTVDFNVGILATHQAMELWWLWKPMVVSKLTCNWIQWMRNLWALVSSITDNLCHLQLDSME